MLPISKPFQIPTGHLFYYNRNNIQMEELKQFFKNEDSEISDSSYEKRDEIYSNIETKDLHVKLENWKLGLGREWLNFARQMKIILKEFLSVRDKLGCLND